MKSDKQFYCFIAGSLAKYSVVIVKVTIFYHHATFNVIPTIYATLTTADSPTNLIPCYVRLVLLTYVPISMYRDERTRTDVEVELSLHYYLQKMSFDSIIHPKVPLIVL